MKFRRKIHTSPALVQRRAAGVLSLMLLAAVVLVGRIGWIQFVEGKHLTERIQNQVMDNKVLQSPRGTIYDRSGRELAISSLTKSLYVNTTEVNQDHGELAGSLAPVLGMDKGELKGIFDSGARFIWIKRTLEPEVAQKVAALIKEQDIKGLGFVEESKRYYPNDMLASHVLGFVGTDDIGLDGVEMTLDKTIKGKLSEMAVETDSHGIPIFKSIFTFVPHKQVKSVYLTIDSTIQFIVEQSLDKVMVNTSAKAATAIVLNPRTGEILAMANRPGYNPNKFSSYNSEDWKNRAVSTIYEPGSTFKTIVAAAGLQQGVVTPNETFVDNGYIEVSGRRINNWTSEPYGTVSFLTILKDSINTGFVQVGMRLGAAKLTDYVRSFGFGKQTGVELPGEEEGILFDPKEMRESDLATMSIGQSIAVTPLQLVRAVAAIANDGVLLKPHIIKEVQKEDGTVESAASAEVVRQVISSDTAHTLADMMEKEVSEGGGHKASVKGYHFAGKTGTAEKLNPNGGYIANHYIASFIGFGPVEDPQIAVLIIIDDPAGIYYGGQIAAPVFSEIAAQIMRHLNIPPDTNLPQAAARTQSGGKYTAAVSSLSAGKVLVPNVIGKTLRQAGDDLGRLGLGLIPAGTGAAVSQSIAPGSIVDTGTEITVSFQAQ
ncbi:MAG: transpeptidase family protein [Pelosinus sp.]|nr:transpeptidase family protein [Pelosinus sp.]